MGFVFACGDVGRGGRGRRWRWRARGARLADVLRERGVAVSLVGTHRDAHRAALEVAAALDELDHRDEPLHRLGTPHEELDERELRLALRLEHGDQLEPLAELGLEAVAQRLGHEARRRTRRRSVHVRVELPIPARA